ncbi:MAG TPA: aspartyl/asparaginyl beta-hydroxylase domain-containing protein [Mucilaginibacter sp.]|nr:aspartyl/asparaginyl beta-hydroxylase domain-containing protein [Mucilaginibacter sp.]
MIRFAKLPLEFDTATAKKELELVGKEWISHFNKVNYDGSWKVLALRSPGGQHQNIVPELMSFKSYENTPFMENFRSVKHLVNQFQCPVMSVRFLNLHAGAMIKPHIDTDLCFEKGEARLHFPVQTNPEVEFIIDGDRVNLNEGDCWYLNANLTHSVVNRGDKDRIHLVIDCMVNDWLTTIMNAAEEISTKPDFTKRELELMIAQLRCHGNEISDKMALEFEQQLMQYDADRQ